MRRIDFFRFDSERTKDFGMMEDVFISDDGAIIYASSQNLGCPTTTATRPYDIRLNEWDEYIVLDEMNDIRSTEQTQADISYLYELDRAPLDVALQVIATEYAYNQLPESQSITLRDYNVSERAEELTNQWVKIYDRCMKETKTNRAAFTYNLPIAS